MRLATDESGKIEPAFEKLKANPAMRHPSPWGSFSVSTSRTGESGLQGLANETTPNCVALLNRTWPIQCCLACREMADGWWNFGNGSQGRMQAAARAQSAPWYRRRIDQGLQGLEAAGRRRSGAGSIPPRMMSRSPPRAAPPVTAAPARAMTQPAASTSAPEHRSRLSRFFSQICWTQCAKSAQITARHYQPRDLKQRQDVSREWKNILSIFQRFPAIIYDQQSEKDVYGFVEFEVTRSGYLFLGVSYKYQGNEKRETGGRRD